jgi:hypothetical protein
VHGLRLPFTARPAFFRFLRGERSDLVRRYRQRYRHSEDPPRLWEEGVLSMMEELRVESGLCGAPPVPAMPGQLSLPFAAVPSGLRYSLPRGNLALLSRIAAL